MAHVYLGSERINMSDSLWAKYVLAVRKIDIIKRTRHREIVERGCLVKYELIPDDPESEWYSNKYIWEANWKPGEITPDKIKNKLAIVFDVDPNLITYVISRSTFRFRDTVIATYSYDGIERLRLALFGCYSHIYLCKKKESAIETKAYMATKPLHWDYVT